MIVLVHGYEGSGPGHWQHWLHDALRERGVAVAFPNLPDPQAPDRDAWVAALADLVSARPRGAGPVTFVAHSLGCWAVDHYLARHGADDLYGALLVAPPSAYSLFEPIQSFLPPPCAKRAWAPVAAHSLLVGSDDDPHASDDETREVAEKLGVACRILRGAGHINADAGFGPLPLAFDWLEEIGALAP